MMMMTTIEDIRNAADAGAGRQAFRDMVPPPTMRAAYVRREDVGLFGDLPWDQKDPRRSVHVGEVPTPRAGPGEALVAVMAAGLNHNTLWTALFEPEPGFTYLDRYASPSHRLDRHVLGSDAAGVVVEVGEGLGRFRPGDEVSICPTFIENRELSIVDDAVTDPGMRAYGFETNFGTLAEFALVRTDQLLPKPAHLTWAEAATMQLVSATCYRMLAGRYGAEMRQGEVVLVWGAAGGLGSFGAQYVRNGGGIPVCVVSSPKRAEVLRRAGFEFVIDRADAGYRFWDGDRLDVREVARFRSHIRRLVGDDPDVVFEHTGRATFPVSVMVPRKGGRIVTCASTTGYEHTYDNRHLWMNVRRIIGSHGATYEENWAANRLACRAMVHPTMSDVVPLDGVAETLHVQHRNEHVGKVGVLCIAANDQGGVRDPDLRRRHLDAINCFRDGAA